MDQAACVTIIFGPLLCPPLLDTKKQKLVRGKGLPDSSIPNAHDSLNTSMVGDFSVEFKQCSGNMGL